MIISISSDQKSFKEVNFKEGFNVILAERTEESTKKDSRNGLGKSTLIEIIHFCLGGNKGETLSNTKMDNWTFIMKIKLNDKIYTVKRNTSDLGKVFLEGDFSGWSILPEVSEGKYFVTVKNWNKILGKLMFGINDSELKYQPTFRGLISYSIRKDAQSGAFLSPFQQYANQMEWDKQIHNAFLLGLNWKFASKLQILKDREKVLNQIRQEAESGLISSLVGNIGELEAIKIRLSSQVKTERAQLDNFNVHPQYANLEDEANRLTEIIHNMINQNIIDKRLIEKYEDSLKEEKDVDLSFVENIYKEAGVIFPESVKKDLSDVKQFHDQIIKNRKEFLITELERISGILDKRKTEINEVSSKREQLLLTLRRHGALVEYNKLQEDHQRAVAELEDVSIRLDNLKRFEEGQSALNVEKELLHQEGKRDLNERVSQREKAILAFNENSKALYQASGNLSIDFKKTGFKFDVEIERAGSQGISNMKIFCYDLMLAQLWSEKNPSPKILVHDSTLFADVDERQKAIALELAKRKSEEKGFQYICTLNSDSIPYNDFSKDFDLNKYVVLTLTDQKEDSGLLGIRF